jgi:ABC-type uncharacterized transport system substrate-binding protein
MVRVWVLCAVTLLQARAGILVAYESGVEAYAEAVGGTGRALGPQALRVDIQNGAELTRAMGTGEVQAVIAVGRHALAEVQARNPTVPVVAAMVMHAQRENGGLVALEVPLALQLETIRSFWPNHLRAGIIRDIAQSAEAAEELEEGARKAGFRILVADCRGPGQLLKTFASMKGKVDFVLIQPDPDLFNAVTIKPLVLSSIENGLPIIGYSPSLVRAGAAAGIYPDYADIGRQAAELAQRLARGEERGTVENPRTIRVAVNQRVERLLGIEFRTGKTPLEVLR